MDGRGDVELLTASGTNPASAWEQKGRIRREYDRGARGYAFVCAGGPTSSMVFPKGRKPVSVKTPFLALHLFVPTAAPFSLELAVAAVDGTRRRLLFSTSFRASQATTLHARIPLPQLPRSQWHTLVFDLEAALQVAFATSFDHLSGITLKPRCRVRAVAGLAHRPAATLWDGDDAASLGDLAVGGDLPQSWRSFGAGESGPVFLCTLGAPLAPFAPPPAGVASAAAGSAAEPPASARTRPPASVRGLARGTAPTPPSRRGGVPALPRHRAALGGRAPVPAAPGSLRVVGTSSRQPRAAAAAADDCAGPTSARPASSARVISADPAGFAARRVPASAGREQAPRQTSAARGANAVSGAARGTRLRTAMSRGDGVEGQAGGDGDGGGRPAAPDVSPLSHGARGDGAAPHDSAQGDRATGGRVDEPHRSRAWNAGRDAEDEDEDEGAVSPRPSGPSPSEDAALRSPPGLRVQLRDALASPPRGGVAARAASSPRSLRSAGVGPGPSPAPSIPVHTMRPWVDGAAAEGGNGAESDAEEDAVAPMPRASGAGIAASPRAQTAGQRAEGRSSGAYEGWEPHNEDDGSAGGGGGGGRVHSPGFAHGHQGTSPPRSLQSPGAAAASPRNPWAAQDRQRSTPWYRRSRFAIDRAGDADGVADDAADTEQRLHQRGGGGAAASSLPQADDAPRDGKRRRRRWPAPGEKPGAEFWAADGESPPQRGRLGTAEPSPAQRRRDPGRGASDVEGDAYAPGRYATPSRRSRGAVSPLTSPQGRTPASRGRLRSSADRASARDVATPERRDEAPPSPTSPPSVPHGAGARRSFVSGGSMRSGTGSRSSRGGDGGSGRWEPPDPSAAGIAGAEGGGRRGGVGDEDEGDDEEVLAASYRGTEATQRGDGRGVSRSQRSALSGLLSPARASPIRDVLRDTPPRRRVGGDPRPGLEPARGVRASEAEALASLLRDLEPRNAPAQGESGDKGEEGGDDGTPPLSPATDEEEVEAEREEGFAGRGREAADSVSWGETFAPSAVAASTQSDAMGKALREAERILGPRSQQQSGVERQASDEVDLLYDPVLNCYYDPATNRYYEIQDADES